MLFSIAESRLWSALKPTNIVPWFVTVPYGMLRRKILPTLPSARARRSSDGRTRTASSRSTPRRCNRARRSASAGQAGLRSAGPPSSRTNGPASAPGAIGSSSVMAPLPPVGPRPVSQENRLGSAGVVRVHGHDDERPLSPRANGEVLDRVLAAVEEMLPVRGVQREPLEVAVPVVEDPAQLAGEALLPGPTRGGAPGRSAWEAVRIGLDRAGIAAEPADALADLLHVPPEGEVPAVGLRDLREDPPQHREQPHLVVEQQHPARDRDRDLERAENVLPDEHPSAGCRRRHGYLPNYVGAACPLLPCGTRDVGELANHGVEALTTLDAGGQVDREQPGVVDLRPGGHRDVGDPARTALQRVCVDALEPAGAVQQLREVEHLVGRSVGEVDAGDAAVGHGGPVDHQLVVEAGGGV